MDSVNKISGPKIHKEPKNILNSHSNPEQKEQNWRHHTTQLINTYKSLVTKIALYRYKDRHRDQWNRIENLEIKLNTCSQLIFKNANKNIKWGKDTLFNKGCSDN